MGEEPDHRADIYAFGVLAFELATATALHHEAEPSAILQRTLSGRPPSASSRNSQIPAGVDGVLRRALARDPAVRHRSVLELIEELVSPPAPEPPPPPAFEPPPAPYTEEEDATALGREPGTVTVDSLIDVLSGVLAPEEDRADG